MIKDDSGNDISVSEAIEKWFPMIVKGDFDGHRK